MFRVAFWIKIFLQNGLLSTHRFSESTHTIQTQPPYQQMMLSFFLTYRRAPSICVLTLRNIFLLPWHHSRFLPPQPTIPSLWGVHKSWFYTPEPTLHTLQAISKYSIYMIAQATGLEGGVHVQPRKEGRKDQPTETIKLWLEQRWWIDNWGGFMRALPFRLDH
jgi:hypothetical protein